MTQNSDFMLLKRTPSKSFILVPLWKHRRSGCLSDSDCLCTKVYKTRSSFPATNAGTSFALVKKRSRETFNAAKARREKTVAVKYSSIQVQKSELVMLSWRKTMRTVTWQAVHINCPYLDILLSEDLKWSPHISNTSKKSNSTRGFIPKKPLPPSLPLQTKCISNTSPSSL